MNGTGRMALALLTGLGVGAGIAILFAPRSGAETREWIAETADRNFKKLRRQGRRSVKQLQGAVTKGEEAVTHVLRAGKDALDTVAARLD